MGIETLELTSKTFKARISKGLYEVYAEVNSTLFEVYNLVNKKHYYVRIIERE